LRNNAGRPTDSGHHTTRLGYAAAAGADFQNAGGWDGVRGGDKKEMLVLQPLLKTTTTAASTTTAGSVTTSLLFLQCAFEEKLDPILVPEDTPSNTQRGR